MSKKVGKYVACLLLCASRGLVAELDPDQYFSLLTDFVYMQRYHVKDNPVVTVCKDGNCDTKTLTTKTLVRNFEPGICSTLSYIQDARTSYEISGLYIWPMDNTATRNGDKNLTLPFHKGSFTHNYFGADKISANYFSQFYTIEANYWKVFSRSRTSFFALSGLFGLRYASIDEKFTVKAYKDAEHSTYKIKADNDLIGLQIGLDFKIRAVKNFYWDLLLKAGVDLNRINATVFLGDRNNTITLRNYANQKAQSGTFAQVAAGAGYQPYDFLNIHAGYQMLFFGGLALAPDQMDRTDSSLSISAKQQTFKIAANGYIIVHGIYTGLK
jgi:hypothetical protein